MPTAFETFVRDECKDVDFGFESARAPLKYTGVGKEIVHVLEYRGYTRVVERLATPLMLGVLDTTDRFDAVVPVPLHRARRRCRGFQLGRAPGAGRRREDKRTCFRYTTSRAQDTGSGRALGHRKEGERFGCVQGRGSRPGKSSPDRRRVHHRRDDGRVRRDPPAGRSK